LSLTDSVAERLPEAVGVNFTLMVQLFCAPSDVPQVFVWLKSPGFVPVIVMDVMLSVVVFDPLVSVSVIGELVVPTDTLPKLSELGANFTTVPIPLRATVWGLPEALSATESVPVSVPVALGVKVTEIVQLAPVAKLDPQVLVLMAKFVPVWTIVILVMETELAPVLVSVAVCAELVVPRSCAGKVRLVGESVTVVVDGGRNHGLAVGSVFKKFSKTWLVLFCPPG